VTEAPDCSQRLSFDITEVEDSQPRIEEVESSPSPKQIQHKAACSSAFSAEESQKEIDFLEENTLLVQKTYYRINSRCKCQNLFDVF